MVEHVWSVLCAKALIDRDSNQVSLLQSIEKVTVNLPGPFPDAPPKPLVPFPVDLVSYWIRSDPDKPELAQCLVTLTAPDGDIVTTTEGPVDLMEFVTLRAVVKSESLPLKSPGYFHFNVFVRATEVGDWMRVARVPFEVEVKTAAKEDAPKSGSGRKSGVGASRKRVLKKKRIH
jgi:hypothetical protein